MKKIVLIAVVIFSMFSCSDDSEGVFDKSPDERRIENKKEFYKHLNSSNWVIELFTGSHEDIGGISIHTSFKDNFKVEVLGELDKSGKPETSSYSLKSMGGALLSFNEYNKGIHTISSPLSFAPKGLFGLADYEFIYLKKEGDIMYTKGVKTRNTIRFVATEKTAQEYFKDLKAVKKFVYRPKNIFYEFNVDGKKIDFVRSRRLFKYNDDPTIKNVDKYKKTSFVLTDKGIRFFKPFKVNDTEIFELILDRESNSLKSADGKVQLKMFVTEIDFNEEYWNIELEEGLACQKALDLYPETNEKAKAHDKVGFEYINLTKTINLGKNKQYGGPGIRFYTSTIRATGYGFDGEYKTIFKPFYDEEGNFCLDIQKNKPAVYWEFISYCEVYVDLITSNSTYTIEVLGKDKDKNGKEYMRLLMKSKKDSSIWFILNNKERPR